MHPYKLANNDRHQSLSSQIDAKLPMEEKRFKDNLAFSYLS